MKTAKQRKRGHPKLSQDKIDEIQRFRKAGFTIRDIAKEVRISESSVEKYSKLSEDDVFLRALRAEANRRIKKNRKLYEKNVPRQLSDLETGKMEEVDLDDFFVAWAGDDTWDETKARIRDRLAYAAWDRYRKSPQAAVDEEAANNDGTEQTQDEGYAAQKEILGKISGRTRRAPRPFNFDDD